jgi:hypothetical protein
LGAKGWSEKIRKDGNQVAPNRVAAAKRLPVFVGAKLGRRFSTPPLYQPLDGVLCPLRRAQTKPLVNCIAQGLFVFQIQTPNVVFLKCDMHYSHIKFVPKCCDEIVLIY